MDRGSWKGWDFHKEEDEAIFRAGKQKIGQYLKKKKIGDKVENRVVN